MTTPTKPQAPAVELPELPDWPEGFPDNWLVTVSEMMRDYARAAIAAAKPEPVGERAELIRKLRRDVTWTPGRHYATQLEEIMDEAANFLEDALLSADAKPAEQANGQEAVYQAQYIGDRWTDVDAQEFESLRGSPTIQSRVLYTTPPAQPAREWVSLTDVQRALEECDVPALYRHSIIDKLREKNAGQPAAARPEIGNQDGKENCHAARPI